MDGFYMTTFLVVLFSSQSFMLSLVLAPSSNFTDQSALLALKSSIKSDPYNVVRTNWTENFNFCDWFGVTCSRRKQRVTALDLRRLGLAGTISPHIGNLSFLKKLYLSNNSFYGYVPREIFALPRLVRISLHRNQLEGEIPTCIKYSQKLEILSLTLNKFTGRIPIELTTLPFLQILYLGGNKFTGIIPSSIGNMTNLQLLGMEGNNIHGIIPIGIGNLPNLIGINLCQNNLTGSIPPAIFNMSTLQKLLFNLNDLSGTLPPTTGLWLPYLEQLAVDNNYLSGRIPLYLSNSSKLNLLTFSDNMFTGTIPTNFGHLKLLRDFVMGNNKLRSESGSSELSFLTAMINCSSLEILEIDQNPLGGVLPHSIGNFSRSLQKFFAFSCNISGKIPRGIGSLNVDFLCLSHNNLHGTLPSTIAGMKRLQRLCLNDNAVEGHIPCEICLLQSLGELDLSKNMLSGAIPYCIGNLSNLRELSLHANSLNSSIPTSLWSLENLLFLKLSSNSFCGNLDIRPQKVLESIDLSSNQISSTIPNSIDAFESLMSLNLSRNSLWGPIPESLGRLITLDYLDLSHNNLSDTIPNTLEALSHLQYLNLSFNKLSGEIPSKGPFKNFTVESFIGNEALCGQPNLQVPPCTYRTAHGHKSKWKIVLLCSLLAIASMIIIIFVLFLLRKYRSKHVKRPQSIVCLPLVEKRIFYYRELCQATDNFSEGNLLGVGSFGYVYKGTLSDGSVVAIKILKLQIEGAFKSFDTECKVLRTVRHRNLVKVISSCSNPELRALILEYMSNGSLEKWLYSDNRCLDLLQRVSIMLDVALALEYLHNGLSEPVIHCDLKPSNVLLDHDMVAHVGDFGISKILAINKANTQTKTLGTLGYIAPEYGSEGKVSKEGDIYSYGIMLLETFTKKNPTNEMFNGDLSLRNWISTSLPNKVLEIIDGNLLTIKDGRSMAAIQSCVFGLMEIGLACSANFPDERSDIKDVVSKLITIKSHLHRDSCSDIVYNFNE